MTDNQKKLESKDIFTCDQYHMNLFTRAYYSMDNTMEMAVFQMARSFMDKKGNAQLKSLQKLLKCASEEEINALKCQIKTYKKIQKSILKIVRLMENRSYDSVSQPKLIKHIDKLWTLRHIMWT